MSVRVVVALLSGRQAAIEAELDHDGLPKQDLRRKHVAGVAGGLSRDGPRMPSQCATKSPSQEQFARSQEEPPSVLKPRPLEEKRDDQEKKRMRVDELIQIAERKFRAQKALDSESCLRWLLNAAGDTLNEATKVGDAGLENEEILTGLTKVRQNVVASQEEFALVQEDGSVRTFGLLDLSFAWMSRTWGQPHYFFSDLTPMKLKNVQQIAASKSAFAALLADGSVVTWGSPDRGGDSAAVQDQLQEIEELQANKWAFAARRSDKTVVTWGDPERGGDIRAVRSQLTDVQEIHSTRVAFAALRFDGTVVAWGDPERGGRVAPGLRGVLKLEATDYALAALLTDGSVVCWGHPDHGGDSCAVQDQLTDVKLIRASQSAFAALRGNGTVVCWGDVAVGGSCKDVQNVEELHATQGAFAALRTDGSVVTWGSSIAGGCSDAVQDRLRSVQQIRACRNWFEAILADSSSIQWGHGVE
eukprot:s2060_g12.t3